MPADVLVIRAFSGNGYGVFWYASSDAEQSILERQRPKGMSTQFGSNRSQAALPDTLRNFASALAKCRFP